jgi:hypothetical protein
MRLPYEESDSTFQPRHPHFGSAAAKVSLFGDSFPSNCHPAVHAQVAHGGHRWSAEVQLPPARCRWRAPHQHHTTPSGGAEALTHTSNLPSGTSSLLGHRRSPSLPVTASWCRSCHNHRGRVALQRAHAPRSPAGQLPAAQGGLQDGKAAKRRQRTLSPKAGATCERARAKRKLLVAPPLPPNFLKHWLN